MTTKRIITAGVTSLAVASVIGLVGVSAASAQTGDTLAAKIATAFHLNQADVQKVIDQDHSDHQATMEQSFEDRLAQDVTDKKITADQKDKIIAKRKDIKTQMDALKDKTQAERRTAMEQLRSDLKTWADQNNIPERYLMMGPGGHGMRGHGGMPPAGS